MDQEEMLGGILINSCKPTRLLLGFLDILGDTLHVGEVSHEQVQEARARETWVSALVLILLSGFMGWWGLEKIRLPIVKLRNQKKLSGHAWLRLLVYEHSKANLLLKDKWPNVSDLLGQSSITFLFLYWWQSAQSLARSRSTGAGQSPEVDGKSHFCSLYLQLLNEDQFSRFCIDNSELGYLLSR